MYVSMHIYDLFPMKPNSEICNFTDDNAIYSCGEDLNETVTNLENDLNRLYKWFAKYGMVANPKNSS